MYCRSCYYDLHLSAADRCPECGVGFDPTDELSFLRTVPTSLERWAFRAAQQLRRLILILLSAAAPVCWFYCGYMGEWMLMVLWASPLLIAAWSFEDSFATPPARAAARQRVPILFMGLLAVVVLAGNEVPSRLYGALFINKLDAIRRGAVPADWIGFWKVASVQSKVGGETLIRLRPAPGFEWTGFQWVESPEPRTDHRLWGSFAIGSGWRFVTAD